MTATKLIYTTLQIYEGTIRNIVTNFIIERRSRRLSKSTIDFYQRELSYFCDYLDRIGVINLDELTPDIIRQYLLYLEENKGRNPGGVHVSYRVIKAMLSWYEFEFEPENWKNPIRKVKLPGVKIQPLPGVPIADIQKMVEAASTDLAIRDKAILLCLVDTGCRAGEFVSLNIGDVDLISGAVVIQRGKGNKSRIVFLGKKSRRAIRQYLKSKPNLKPSAPLITTDEDERFTVNGLRQVVIRRAKDANIPVPGLHDFRRCFALQMKRNGADVITISRMLGHSSLEVTKRYLAQDESDFQEIHRQASPVDCYQF